LRHFLRIFWIVASYLFFNPLSTMVPQPDPSTDDSSDPNALSSLVEEVLLTSESGDVEDLDFFADDDLADDMDVAKSLPAIQPRSSTKSYSTNDLSGSLTGSITESIGGGRRVSRASLAWFQKQTAENTAGLITGDGKLSDDYILKRQSVNRPAMLKSIPRLADLSSEITQVDGWVLTQMFLSGFAKLSKQVGESNAFLYSPSFA
jgi:hypothetical protein